MPAMRKYSALFALMLVLIVSLLAGCDIFARQAVPTPIIITATIQQFIIVTNTPTPSATPVLAPTLPLSDAEADNSRPSPTSTAAASPTPNITLTPTFTVTPTDTPVTPGAVIGPVGGAVAGTPSVCAVTPTGSFGEIYANNPELAAQLGCPLGSGSPLAVSSAFQTYERGIMIWVSSVGEGGAAGIYAIYNNGSYQRFNDTWREGVDPIGANLAPPAGLVEPIRGFGKVWRETAGVSDALGWATSGEVGGSAFLQAFERGEMIAVAQNGQIYIMISGQPGTWTSLAGTIE